MDLDEVLVREMFYEFLRLLKYLFIGFCYRIIRPLLILAAFFVLGYLGGYLFVVTDWRAIGRWIWGIIY